MNTRKFVFKSPFNVVGLIFLFGGIGFICIALAAAAFSDNFKKHATEVEGIIDDIYREEVYVTYEADGELISTRLNFYSSSMRIGDTITLYYDNDDPYIVQTSNASFLYWIFFFTGALFAVLGIILLISQRRKKARSTRLLETGVRFNAEIVSIGMDMKISSNYHHPYVIDCRYQAPDGVFYTFRSGPVWQNPSHYLTSEYVPVYVDPNNYSNYYVDLSSILPKEIL